MNTKRIIVLGFALVAASAAALLARGLMGGGTPKVEAKIAPPIAMSRYFCKAFSSWSGCREGSRREMSPQQDFPVRSHHLSWTGSG